MDRDFSKNQLKPGDPGFVYDKVVEFKKSSAPLQDDSWGEDDEDQNNNEEYYDEEDELE
jgi:centrosomal protein CEP19